MKKQGKIWSMIIISIFLLSYICSGTPVMAQSFSLDGMKEITRDKIAQEKYYSILDEKGNVILKTGRRIHVGDEYLTSDNKLYKVYKVEDMKAYARFVEKIDLQAHLDENFRKNVLAMSRYHQDNEMVVPVQVEPIGLVAIYHTHNAESYVPSDGTDSIYGKGGIHEVGATFAEAMREKGVEVIHDETLHLPHDRGAYRRSRETVQRLLAEEPDVIFDIHRDAAPMEAYAAQIEGEWVTQVQLVVGRQNHNFDVNKSFALDLKGYTDDMHPDLVKGIFFAQGNYNQDLTPLNLLLEVGAHTNSKEAAAEGAAFFADVVDYYFYGPLEAREPEPEAQAQEELFQEEGAAPVAEAPARRSMLLTALSILLGAVVVSLAFLYINSGSKEEFITRLAGLRGKVIISSKELSSKIRKILAK